MHWKLESIWTLEGKQAAINLVRFCFPSSFISDPYWKTCFKTYLMQLLLVKPCPFTNSPRRPKKKQAGDLYLYYYPHGSHKPKRVSQEPGRVTTSILATHRQLDGNIWSKSKHYFQGSPHFNPGCCSQIWPSRSFTHVFCFPLSPFSEILPQAQIYKTHKARIFNFLSWRVVVWTSCALQNIHPQRQWRISR